MPNIMKLFTVYLIALCFFASNAIAGTSGRTLLDNGGTSIGILMVTGEERLCTDRFFQSVENIVRSDKNKKYNVLVGENLQNRYVSYCRGKGLSSATPPKMDNLLEFARDNHMTYIVCLCIPSPEIDTYRIYDGRECVRVALKVNAYLCNENGLVKAVSTAEEKDAAEGELKGNPLNRCFNSCMKNIGNGFKGCL